MRIERVWRVAGIYFAAPIITPGRKSFSNFYKEEILTYPRAGCRQYVMARMRLPESSSVLLPQMYNQAIRGGCEHVINLYGSVFDQCPHCELCTVDDMLNKGIPSCCRVCNSTIEPKVFLCSRRWLTADHDEDDGGG